MQQNLLICIGDGDNIGDVIDLHLLSKDLDGASNFSLQVKTAIEKIAEFAKNEINASLVYVAGDDICFTVLGDMTIKDKLLIYSDFFFQKTGKTLSFGVGRDSIEALVCLRKAKVSGKGCVITFGGED